MPVSLKVPQANATGNDEEIRLTRKDDSEVKYALRSATREEEDCNGFLDDEASEASDGSLEEYGDDEYELTDGEDLGSEDTWSECSLVDEDEDEEMCSNDSFIVEDLCSEDEARLRGNCSSSSSSYDSEASEAEKHWNDDDGSDSDDSIIAAAMACNEDRLGRACDEALRSIEAAKRISETPLPLESVLDTETLEPLAKRSASSSPVREATLKRPDSSKATDDTRD